MSYEEKIRFKEDLEAPNVANNNSLATKTSPGATGYILRKPYNTVYGI